MKTVLYFVGLKSLEISGAGIVVFLIVLFGSRIEYWLNISDGIWRLDTMVGFLQALLDGLAFSFLGLAIIFLIVLGSRGVYVLIKKNWQWAKKLSKK